MPILSWFMGHSAVARGLQPLEREVAMRVQYPNEVPTEATHKYVREAHPERDPQHSAMTLAQASYLMTLCEETGEVLDDSLTRAQAAQRIEELEDATGRSRAHGRTNLDALTSPAEPR